MTELRASMLLDPLILDAPYDFYRTLRQDAPVWVVPGTDCVVVSSFTLLSEAVLRTEDFSSTMKCLLYRDERGLPARLDFGDAALPTLATADPPVHTTQRRAVFPELVARRMRALEGDIDALAESAVKHALHDNTFEFMAEIGNVIPITVMARLIGFRDTDPERLLQAAFDSTTMVGGTVPLDQLNNLIGRIGTIQAWIADQVAGAGEGDDEGILFAVRRALDVGTLQMGEATVILHTLLSAGGESTTSLIGNAVRMLAEDPDMQQHLREHPEAVDVYVEEVLRLESPFRQMMRSVPHDTTLGGTRIEAGSTVLLLFAAGNRDPDHYDDPDLVDLERGSPRHHLAFGQGIHFCVGAALARIETRAVLKAVLAHTSNFALHQQITPQWVDSLLVRRHHRLPIEATAR